MAFRFYQIAPGDTLSELSARLGVSVEELARLNKIADPNRIRAGEMLMVPTEPSPDDRLRVERAKAAPRHEAAQAERPSRTAPAAPKINDAGVAFEVNLGPATQRAGAPQAKGAAGGRAPQAQGFIETDKSVPYPPFSPRQLLYPEFWGDFLSEVVPEALAALPAGRGAAFMRALGRMRALDNPFVQINPQRAEFARKTLRHVQRNPGEPVDPNFGQVFEPQVSPPRPSLDEALAYTAKQRFPRYDYSDFRSTETPAAAPGENTVPFWRAMLEHVMGLPFGGINRTISEMDMHLPVQTRPALEAARSNVKNIQLSEPKGSSFAKGTTVAKNVSPFAAAIRRGMERARATPITDAVQVAGPGYVPGPDTSWTFENMQRLFHPDVHIGRRFYGVMSPERGTHQPEFGDPYTAPFPQKEMHYEVFPPGTGMTPVGDVLPFPDLSRDPRQPGKLGMGGAIGPRQGGNVYNFQRTPPVSQNTKYEVAKAEQRAKIKRPEFKLLEPRYVDHEMPYFLQNPAKYVDDLSSALKSRTAKGDPAYDDAVKLLDYFAKLKTALWGAQ